jgi:transcriptional regulator with XRE-family HTH domain
MVALAEIGDQIAFARKRRDLTQVQLAEKSGVSRATIDLLENGRASEIGYSRLARILATVGLELHLQAVTAQRPTLEDLLNENSDNA